jgi:sec-independent protein translocase protein TatA
MNTLFAWAIGGTELIIILVAVLILFGSKKIPEFARGLGQGIKEFKKASREVTDEIQNAPAETPAPPGKSPAAVPPPAAPTVSQSSNPPKV